MKRHIDDSIDSGVTRRHRRLLSRHDSGEVKHVGLNVILSITPASDPGYPQGLGWPVHFCRTSNAHVSTAVIGKVMRISVPGLPASEPAAIVPPWASTRLLAIGRPSPLPGESGER